MKLIVALTVLVTVAVARPEGDHYDSKYDNFDVDSLVNNPRLLKGFTNCFLGKGTCTPDGNTFKKVLPEAMSTTCGKCTPKQRTLVRKIISAIKQQLPEEWEELVKLHDPEGKYKDSLTKFLQSSD